MNIYKKLPEDIQQNIDIIFLQQQNKYYNLSVLQLNKLFNLYNKNFNTTSKLHVFCKGYNRGQIYRKNFNKNQKK